MVAIMFSAVALGLSFDARGVASRGAVRAPAANMLFGLGQKESSTTPMVVAEMTGSVVPTKPSMSPALLKAVGLPEDHVQAAGEALIDARFTAAIISKVAVPVMSPDAPLSVEEVEACQSAWASAIKTISSVYLQGGDFVQTAVYAASELYGYGMSNVLFKPTKAAEFPFRPTAEDAFSYFVGADAVEDGYAEDGGFAINGGKGWSDVQFTNHQIEVNGNNAIAMGYYIFTCATTGEQNKVEYTFGYKRNPDGKARIFLHHSSVPYSAGGAAAAPAIAPVTKDEVEACQAKWANAIQTISKTYLEKGDYVATAAEAAGELYGYGHTNVLFKPTKAAEFAFRPTGEEAMSYFVGADAVKNGYKEDGGFAINGGKGWSNVVFSNHQVECHSEVAIAMGSYDFTCATTGSVAKVEYTFGYKRNDDGKVRICLHHSSVPYSS